MHQPPDTFTKITAAGNDFVCVDNTDGRFDAFLETAASRDWIRAVCRRGLGVGADGVIFGCRTGDGTGVHICARFMEPDGSESELCGNGTACCAWWVVDKGLAEGPEVRILTAAGAAVARIVPDRPGRVRVCVPDPRNLEMDVRVDVKGEQWTLDYVVTGVPHAVGYVDHIDRLDVSHWGPGIRRHPRFNGRVNANFVEVLDVGVIALRTWEFGVEAETLACGTGSAAAAILSCLRFRWPEPYRTGEKPVRVRVRSGHELHVWFVCRDDRNVIDVCVETSVQVVYEGTLRQEFIQERQERPLEIQGDRAVSTSTM